MATKNPFDLLGEDDSEDLSQLVASLKTIVPKSVPAPTQNKTSTQFKQPPGQAESKFDSGRGNRVSGRERGGSYRDSYNNKNSYGNKEVPSGHDASNGWTDSGKYSERRGGANGGSRGGRRDGYSNGEGGGDRARYNREAVDGDRGYDRQHYNNKESVDGNRGYGRARHNNREIVDGDRSRDSGSWRGTEVKREGSGQENWDAQTDEQTQVVKEAVIDSSLNAEKPSGEVAAADGDKEAAINEVKNREPFVKLLTLEEYEKVLEEKRKALQLIKTEERKVDVNEFQSMQPLANKKANNDIFIKLGSEKDKKKEKELAAEKEEKATKKSVSINEFLRNNRGGRGQGRGRGGYRGVNNGGYDKSNVKDEEVKEVSIAFEDKKQFPTLGTLGSK